MVLVGLQTVTEVTINDSVHTFHVQTIRAPYIIQRNLIDGRQIQEKNIHWLKYMAFHHIFPLPDVAASAGWGISESSQQCRNLCHRIYVTFAVSKHSQIIQYYLSNTVTPDMSRSIISKKTHERHPIARPLGRDMGCLLWIQIMIYIIP